MATYEKITKNHEVNLIEEVEVKKNFETYNILTLKQIDERIISLNVKIQNDTARLIELQSERAKILVEAEKVVLKVEEIKKCL